MIQLSIIIPNYNHASFLKKRIDSILEQTYQNFELIILDDCSTDDSKIILEHYKSNSKISNLIFNKKNSGSVFQQWQKGISLSKGEYIWIAESDDYSDPYFLEEVIKKFEFDPKIGIVYCDSNIIVNETIHFDFYKNYKNNMFKTNRWSHDHLSIGVDEINDYLIYDCTINNTSAMVFKKSLISKQVFDNLSLFRYSGDWYFFLNISQECNIYYIYKALNYFRQGTNNFAKGVKSPLNHFKERSLVRYLILKDFSYNIRSPKNVFKELGKEFRFKLFDLIKNPNHFKEFYTVCYQLLNSDRVFFLKQLKYMFNK